MDGYFSTPMRIQSAYFNAAGDPSYLEKMPSI
jgi:hypothetical protein